jgi:hypothetical protein
VRTTKRDFMNGGPAMNLLQGRPLEGRISGLCAATPDDVYGLLVDLSSHLEWGGRRRRSKGSRLLSLTAPPGPAAVATEFTSTGEDALVRMRDRSVVTEATRPSTFEFVTESSWKLKRSGKRTLWTIVHRYDLAPVPDGCRVRYMLRATRATALPGPLVVFRVRLLRPIATWMSLGSLRGGFRNLLSMAEERATTRAPTGADRRRP